MHMYVHMCSKFGPVSVAMQDTHIHFIKLVQFNLNKRLSANTYLPIHVYARYVCSHIRTYVFTILFAYVCIATL